MRTVRFGHPLQQEKDDPGDCFFGLFAGKVPAVSVSSFLLAAAFPKNRINEVIV